MSQTNDVAHNRQRMARMLQMHGYSACSEALLPLVDHYTSSNRYNSIEEFIQKLNRTITFETDAGSSIIDPDLAYLVIQKLCNASTKNTESQNVKPQPTDGEMKVDDTDDEDDDDDTNLPVNLDVRVKNVEYQQFYADRNKQDNSIQVQKPIVGPSRVAPKSSERENEFKIHYSYLQKRLESLSIFKDNFQLTKLSTLTGSSQPSIKCICFGLLVKDISKIDGYMLIDNTGRVPVRITPDTAFRNRLAYTNCIVLVEGVYVNPDDILFAANIGLPPVLLEPIQEKSLACRDEKMIVILRELFMDDEDVCKHVDMLFTGYNSMQDPPALFILIGDFTRQPFKEGEISKYTKRLIRIIRTCDNLKDCHFVLVPGSRDTCYLTDGDSNNTMPKPPLTQDQMPIKMLQLSKFNYIHLATNPAHIYFGDRLISVVCHSYLKELSKNLLHDLSDRRDEIFNTAKQIILSNAHLSAGITRSLNSSMNLWHRPDLLVLADTEAFGNKFDFSSSKSNDTTFATLPSFSRQFSQFKVYYLKSGEIEESQVSPDAMSHVIEFDDDSDDEKDELQEQDRE